MSKEIGFVGLGNMGEPMAERLIAAGYSLTVFDARRDAVKTFEAKGCKGVSSAKAVADAVETVFVSLPTPAIVEKVITGEDGVIEGSSVKRVIDLSTTGATTSVRIAAALGAKGIAHMDSPVSGGKQGAAKGTLAVMVSGPKADYAVVEPMLAHIGKLFFIGEQAGLGQTMKLTNNLLSATAMAATSEAVVMAAKAGIDPRIAIAVFNVGSGRNSASEDKFPNAILPRTFDYGFTTGLMYKDLRLCMAEAEEIGVQMIIANAVKQVWQLTNNELGPQSDFTRVVQMPEKWAGIQLAKSEKP